MNENVHQVNERGRAVEPNVTDDEKTWALLMHLSLLGHLIVPLLTVLVPLFMWMSKKDNSPYIDDHGREALNFQITLIIYSFVLPIASLLITAITCGVAFPLVIVAAILPTVLGLVGMIPAAMAANRGEYYRYPMTIRFFT